MAKSFSKEKQHTHVDQQAAYVSYIIDFILNIFIHEKKKRKRIIIERERFRETDMLFGNIIRRMFSMLSIDMCVV